MEWQQPTRQSERPCIGPSLSQYSERMEFTPGNTVMFRPSEVVQIETVSGSSSSYDQEEIIPQYLQGSVSKKYPENYSSEDTCSVLWKSSKYSHGSSIPIWLPRNKSANMSDRKKSCSNASGNSPQHTACLQNTLVPEQLENDISIRSQGHVCSSPYVNKVSGIQNKLHKEMATHNNESITHHCGSLDDASVIDLMYCDADLSKPFCIKENEQLTLPSRSRKGYSGSNDIFMHPPMKSLESMKQFDNFAHINVKSVGVFPMQELYVSQPFDERETTIKNVRSISEVYVVNEENLLGKSHVGKGFIDMSIMLDDEGVRINKCSSVLNEGSCSVNTQKYGDSEAPNIAKLYRVFVAGEHCISDEEVMINKDMIHSVLNSSIVNALLKKGLKATRLQAYTWPVIAKGTSVVIVGEKFCGKTMGYVVPLLSNILDSWKLMSERLSPGIGPVMVVVCSTWRSARCVADYIVSLLPASVSFKIMTAWGGCGNEEEVSTGRQLLSGCDILLTTAPCLMRLLMGSQQGAATTLKRCCHLVFDDVEVILQNFSLEVKKIFTIWGEERRKCGRPDLDLQAVLVSSRWTELLGQLTEVLLPLLDPLIVISAPCEAAIATRVASHIHFVSNETEALSLVMKLINTSYVYKRKMVFVSNDDSAELLESVMNNAGMSCALVSSTTHMWKVQQLVHEWHMRQNMTMIVSHEAEISLLRHDLANAEVLFHTHLGLSLTTFTYRYSFMSANFVTDLSKKSTNCESHVILSEFTLEKLPGVLEELYRICGFPEAIKATAALVCNGKNTKYTALCYYLKAYGRCNRPVCGFRHEVQMLDIPQNIPRSGEVTFKVINTLSASRYLVHIMQYREQAGSQCVDLSNSYSTLQTALQNHFTDRAHCESLRSAEPGMLCAVQDEGIWTRAQIISVNHKEAGTLINAFLVDEGKQVTVNLESALVLPSYLATVPHLVVEVLLCRVQPLDFDPEWTLQASNFVYSIFAKRKDSRFIGRINLALGSTLWLNPVAEFIKIGKTFVQKKALREKLISEKFGVDNPTHMKNIQHLCAKAGVSLEPEAVCGQAWRKILTESLERLQADRVKEDPCGNTSANPGVYFERYSNEETQSREEQKNNVIGSRANTLCSISQGRQVLLPQHQEQKTCSITPPNCPALPQEDLSFNQTIKAEVVEAVSLKELIKADEVKELNSLEAEISCSAEWLGSSDHKALDVESYCCLRSIPCSASCIASVTSNKYCKDVIRASRSSDSTTVFFADHGETMQVSACQHDEKEIPSHMKQGTGTECKVQEKKLSGSFNNTSVSILQDEMYKLMSPLKNGVRKDTYNSVESLKNECQNHSLCTESKGETVFSSVYATLPKYHYDGADKEEELSKRVTDDQEKYQGCIKTGESTFVGQQDDMFLLRHIGISRTTGLASEISWSQDEDVVQVIIHLAGVEQYKCHLSSSQLVFMTSIKEKLHALDGNLAGEIDADHSFVTVHRNNICIILRKAVRGEWRCLFSSGNNKSKASQE